MPPSPRPRSATCFEMGDEDHRLGAWLEEPEMQEMLHKVEIFAGNDVFRDEPTTLPVPASR
jgi:hypothetical protein